MLGKSSFELMIRMSKYFGLMGFFSIGKNA